MLTALATFTDSGMLCFRKQSFQLAEGYHTCYGEESEDGSYTRFFREFSCATMKTELFDVLSPEHVASIHRAIGKLAGVERRAIILTVTDLAMVNMTKNMIRSLYRAGEQARCLVVGIEANLCLELGEPLAECLELPLRGQREADGIFAWGTAGYMEAVFLKHVVLTVSLLSGRSEGILFTDPDVVYLKPPLDEIRSYGTDLDMIFSTNNALTRGAQHCSDVAKSYRRQQRGIASLTTGDEGAHVDINSGLLYLRHTTATGELLMRTLMFLAQERTARASGYYQQWSMVRAIQAMPSLRIAPVPCNRFVNGNVFWGHNMVLDPDSVISVHANWMHSSLKRTCLELARLWDLSGNHSEAGGATSPRAWWEELRSVPVQLTGSGVIVACGAPPRTETFSTRFYQSLQSIGDAMSSMSQAIATLWAVQ